MRKACLVLFALTTGCATSAPVGGRHALRDFGPEGMFVTAPARPVPHEDRASPIDPSTLTGDRDTVVSLARSLLGHKSIALGGKRYGSDCTGLVRGVYEQIGLELVQDAKAGDNGVTALYRFAQRHGRVFDGGWPMPGDLVFFRDTYDQNRDGRRGDGLTHVGLVDDVESDGTVWVIHRVHRGVVRYRMNLQHRHQRRDPSGKIWNDVLRAPGAGAEVLTGELFVSFATLFPPAQVAQR